MNSENKTMRGRVAIAIVAVIAVAVVIGIISFSINNPSRKLKAQLDLGQKYLTELKYEEAVAAFTEAFKIEPNEETEAALVSAYITWSDSLLADSNYDKAMEVLKQGYDLTGNQSLQDKISEIQKMIAAAKEAEEQAEAEQDTDEKYHGLYDAIIATAEYEVLGKEFSDWTYDSFTSYVEANGTLESMDTSEHRDYFLPEGYVEITSERDVHIFLNSPNALFQIDNGACVLVNYEEGQNSKYPILGMSIEELFASVGLGPEDIETIKNGEIKIRKESWSLNLYYFADTDSYWFSVSDRKKEIGLTIRDGLTNMIRLNK